MEVKQGIIVEFFKPKVSVEYDIFGGVDIKLDDFVFVHINYNHRYTHNLHRAWLAEQIRALVAGGDNVGSNASVERLP